MNPTKFYLPENFGTLATIEGVQKLKEFEFEKVNFHCKWMYGDNCGLGVQIYLNNTDTSHGYNVTLNLYTNGAFIQSFVVGVPAGGTTYMGCSRAGSFSYIWVMVGEQAY